MDTPFGPARMTVLAVLTVLVALESTLSSFFACPTKYSAKSRVVTVLAVSGGCGGIWVPDVPGIWKQIWRVAWRESCSPELLESPRTSPEVPQTSLEVFRRLPQKFSRGGT